MKKEVKVLTQKDKGLVLDYLERNHIETTFLIGNVNEYGLDNNKDLRRCGDYYGYFEEDELKGVLPIYNLGSCIPHFEAPGAVPYFSEIMKEREFGYLLGMSSVVDPLYEAIKDYKVVNENSDDSYFVNNDFKPFVIDGLDIEDYSLVDKDKADEFIMDSRNRGFNESVTREQAARSIANRPPEEDVILELKDGECVALALIQTTTSKISQIGGVYTSVEHRGKGYCKAVVSELCRRIIERGKIPTLMVKKANTPAVKAYTALGFKHYADYRIISFK